MVGQLLEDYHNHMYVLVMQFIYILGVPVFGGYKNLGKGSVLKQTVDLPPHYRLKFKFTVLKIDSWDNEFATLKVDGT